MEMIEQSQRIFGLIAKLGSRETFATMEIKTAITNLHREEARQERKGEKVVMRGLKYHENYVWKYSVVLAGNTDINAIENIFNQSYQSNNHDRDKIQRL